MKTIVIYKSKTGYTQKYAGWIAEELSADIREASKIDAEFLCEYDVIIFGGSLHAVGINGIKVITDNFEKLKGKKLIVFATGVSPLKDEALSEIKYKNFTGEELKVIKLYYLRGGFNFKALPLSDKILMLMLKAKIRMKKKENLTADEKGMLAIFNKPIDYTKRENINSILEYARNID
ncbi:MAG: flavodoxin domain-containing protein [Bacillota bacterium]|nr:flavodoxin domain-containing protein [Bacillota bacterium]